MEEDTVDIESTADAINNMQVEDPLDVPAFMRGKK